MLEGFDADAVCLGIRRAVAETALLTYELARGSGCCCWLDTRPDWVEAVALLLEHSNVDYRGRIEELIRDACGLTALRLLEHIAPTLLAGVLYPERQL